MTEAHRKAQATYVDKRKEQGERKMTFWVTPKQAGALDRFAGQIGGSRQQALAKLLDALE
jgi:hypothetical protein